MRLTGNGPQRWILLIAILWLAFALRFFALGAQELRGDEAASWARITQEPGPIELFQRLIAEGQPHPPLHYWLLQAWARVLGYSEYALRSLSALLSVLVVALVYRVGIRLRLSPSVAILAALLAAVHPYQIWLGQDAKNMYQLSLIGILIATLQLPGLLAGRGRAWIIYVFSGAFAMLSHYYAIFGLLAQGIYVLLAPVRWSARWRWGLAGLGIAGLMLPWALVAVPGMASHQFSFARSSGLALGAFFSQTLGDAAVGPSMPDAPALLAAFVMAALIALGGISLWPAQRAAAGFLISWILIALAGSLVVMRIRPTYNTFYMSNAYPGIYLLTAVALDRLRTQRILLIAAGAAVVVAFTISLNNYYFDPRWSKSRGLRELAAYLQVNAGSHDLLITNMPDPATIYYLRELALPNTLLPAQHNFDPAAVTATLDRLAADHDRLWLIPVRFEGWDANGFIETQLADQYASATDERFNRMRLRSFTAYPKQLPQYQTWNASFDDGVQLLGSYVTINGEPQPERAEPGQWLRVTVWWSAAEAVTRDYKVFVHAVDANGQVVAQHDSMPRNNSAPTSQWLRGQTIMDLHEFQIPPESATAAVRIDVGLYDPETGQRLKLLSGGDSASVWYGLNQ
jgi:uncharacterized membrane protein